jgi:hypothetical protein
MMIDRRTLLAAMPALAAIPAFADATSSTASSAVLDLMHMGKDGRYQPWYAAFLKADPGGPSGQDRAQVIGMCGDEAGAMKAWRDAGLDYPDPAPDLSTAHAKPALETIARMSKGRRVVILNEAHHISRSRAFGEQVMARLREEGFSIFAAEAFDNGKPPTGADLVNRGGVVNLDLGVYTRDPVFAELVRAAHTSGYKLATYEETDTERQVSYGSFWTDVAVREELQAKRLQDVLDANPKHRAFVYCGYEHVEKNPKPGKEAWLAARLARRLKTDPLCITQTGGFPEVPTALDHPFMAAVQDKFHPTEPIVIADNKGPLQSLSQNYGKGVDLSVFHPRMDYIDERPGWLVAAPGRKRAQISLPAPAADLSLIQAVRSDEFAKDSRTVPSDQYPLAKEAREAVLYLKPGQYTLRMDAPDGRSDLGPLTVA